MKTFDMTFELNDITFDWYIAELKKHCDTLPDGCKGVSSLKSFEKNLKRWIPENCPYKLCKTCIQCVGFV